MGGAAMLMWIRFKWGLTIAAVLGTALVFACASNAPEPHLPAQGPSGDTVTYFSALTDNVEKYRILIGLKQERIENMFDEPASAMGDTGVEFKKSAVRIWFDPDHGRATHVMILSKQVDFQGAKLGEGDEAFDRAFGKARNNPQGSDYKDYDYEGLILRLHYDKASGKSEAVSLMAESTLGDDKK